MSDMDLRREPHTSTRTALPDFWWYEVPDGISVYSSVRPLAPHIALIPWDALRAALARKDKPAKPKRRARKAGGAK